MVPRKFDKRESIKERLRVNLPRNQGMNCVRELGKCFTNNKFNKLAMKI